MHLASLLGFTGLMGYVSVIISVAVARRVVSAINRHNQSACHQKCITGVKIGTK